MSEKELRIERTLPGPIEKVWEHLTDPAKAAGWLANDVTLEPCVGAGVTLELEDGEVVNGTVTRCEPPHVFAYTWSDGQVTFELVPRGRDVVLVLTHTKHVRVHARAAAQIRMAA